MSRHTKILTRSFAGGEMSPEMFGRMDDVKFQAGAATLLNFVPKPAGATARRSGTRLVRETRDAAKVAHLFPFVFSQTESLVIEASRATVDSLEGGYFRFHQNGGTLLYSQPERFTPALGSGSSIQFKPCQTVQCNVHGVAMTVTLINHGLSEGDAVQFISSARTVPGGVSTFTNYYVRPPVGSPIADDSFQLSTSKTGGSRLASNTHPGYYPVLFNWAKWRAQGHVATGNVGYYGLSEHRLKNKDRIVITMWPQSTGPSCDFDSSTFTPSKSSGRNHGLASTSGVWQQVVFVPDGPLLGSTAGAVLPSNIEAGRIYWATHSSGTKWKLSKTYGGALHSPGSFTKSTVPTSQVRMAAMPRVIGGSVNYLGCLEPYYVIAGADPNAIRLEKSIGAGQVVNGGIQFAEYGCGEIKIRRASETGELVSLGQGTNDVRTFYARKAWWEPESEASRNLLTLEIKNQTGSRVPGTSGRTSLTQGEHWRRLPGISTGEKVAITPSLYGAGDLVLTTVGGVQHGFSTAQAVSFVEGVAPAGYNSPAGTIYYVIYVNSTSFKLASSIALAKAGTALPGPNSASTIHGSVEMQGWVEFENTGHTVHWPSHGLSNGDTMVFSSETGTHGSSVKPSEIEYETVYYVREKTTDAFRLSATSVGPLMTFSGTGTRVMANGNAIYEVPHDYSEDELPKITTTQSNDVLTLASRDHPVTELRRLSATKWDLVEPEFTAAAPIPGALYEVDIEVGETTFIYEIDDVQIPGQAIGGGSTDCMFKATSESIPFVANDPVYLEADTSLSKHGPQTGFYLIAHVRRIGNVAGMTGFEFWLKYVNTNTGSVVRTTYNANPAVSATGRIRYGATGDDFNQKYVVTAIDSNNEESPPTDPLEVTNNLFISGASNEVGWGASLGAVRYRVYKELGGLFGLIGETDDLTFKDDNIGPDLSVSPPIPDTSLREESVVTFDATSDTVNWTAHGLSARTPVVFKTSDQMPGINEGQTYFVMNSGTNEFQVTDDLATEAIVNITGTDTGSHTAVAGNFPSAVSYFEGRRIFAGSRALPQDIWMTASGTESDLTYSIPTVDSDRIYFRIASRESSAVRHLLPMSQLVLLSDSTEYRLTPANDDVLTPSSISVRPQSFVGADYPHPALVNNTVVFAAARGGHVRELGYNQQVLGYLTGDLSIRAAHLFDGFTIKDQAYSKAPLPIVWCVSSSGKLLGITYIPEEQVGAWHQHTTPAGGEFESVVSIPEGDEDAVYVVVKRTINDVTKRFVERFASEYRGDTSSLSDAYFVDSGLTYSGASTTTISGLDHLEGEAVSYLADGVAGTGTVTSGALTLTKAATKVHVGLGYVSQIQTLPLTMMRVDAFGTGKTKNVNQVWVRAFQSGAFKAGPTASNLRSSLTPSAGSLLTDLVRVTLPASWDDDGQIVIQQDAALPLTVAGLTIEVASGG